MVNRNIQMKKREGNDWDNLYPISLTENIYTKNGTSLDNEIENIDTQLAHMGLNIMAMPAPFESAKGDGITDDTAVLQQAIDLSDYVIIPKGQFKVSSVTVPEDVLIEGQGKQSVFNHFGNQPLFVLHDGFKGSMLSNFRITGGTDGVFAIEIGRPHSVVSHIYIDDYKGSGIDLITLNNSYGTSTWCQRIDHFTYIGHELRTTEGDVYSPATSKTFGVRMNVHGGNVIMKDFNIQIANVGVDVVNCEQLTLIDFNISECSQKVMTNTLEKSSAISLKQVFSTRIEGGYLENYDTGILLNNAKNTTIEKMFFSAGSSLANLEYDVHIENDNLNTKISNSHFRDKTGVNVKAKTNNVGVIIELLDGTLDIATPYFNNEGRRVSGSYELTKNYNVVDWVTANGSSDHGIVYLGSESGRVYTTDNMTEGKRAEFVLPAYAEIGAEYTFVKTKPSTLVVKPHSGGKIIPDPAVVDGYKELGGALIGSIKLVHLFDGWHVMSQIGDWAERG